MWDQSLAWLRGWRIWCCREQWRRSQMPLRSCTAVAVMQAGSCSTSSTPSLGSSVCLGCRPKIAQKNKQKIHSKFPTIPKDQVAKYHETERQINKLKLPDRDFILFFFLGLHLWHIEVSRLGVELELQLQPIPQPQQHQILVTSVTYAAAFGNSRTLTYGVSQRLNPHPHRHCVGFLTH